MEWQCHMDAKFLIGLLYCGYTEQRHCLLKIHVLKHLGVGGHPVEDLLLNIQNKNNDDCVCRQKEKKGSTQMYYNINNWGIWMKMIWEFCVLLWQLFQKFEIISR